MPRLAGDRGMVHFATRRSSDLPSFEVLRRGKGNCVRRTGGRPTLPTTTPAGGGYVTESKDTDKSGQLTPSRDRKSTRLNSSHTVISYADAESKKKSVLKGARGM